MPRRAAVALSRTLGWKKMRLRSPEMATMPGMEIWSGMAAT